MFGEDAGNAQEARVKTSTGPETAVVEFRDLQIVVDGQDENGRPSETVIIDNISRTLEKGQVLGLIGESGAGKSTLGLSSMGFERGGLRISQGQILLNGRDILSGGRQGLNKLRGRQVCYVAQSAAAAFNPAKRLMDQVVESALKHGVASRAEAERRAVALFRKLQLPEPETIGRRFPHQVSGGQLQRVMTVMALCPEPDVIIFDEPTTALDVTTQIEVLVAIKSAIRDTGVAAIYITHDLAVVAQVADDIMVLRQGKLVEQGPVRQIIENPQEPYTQALVSVRELEHTERLPEGEPVLRAANITARYGTGTAKVLDDVSVDLHAGQTLSIVGESGSGKSTLARVMTGLLSPSNGQVRFDGRTLSKDLEGRSKSDLRELQMIFQMADVAMNPRHTVGTIIGRPLTFYFGLRGRKREERVIELLEEIELGEEFIDRYPSELSGGQKQRVCIARALAAKPKVIICDEITSALDPLVANGILRLLLRLQKAESMALAFITHDLETVRSIADSIAVMHKGKVVRYGLKSEVLSPPFDDYTKLLLTSVPKMEVGWLEGELSR